MLNLIGNSEFSIVLRPVVILSILVVYYKHIQDDHQGSK